MNYTRKQLLQAMLDTLDPLKSSAGVKSVNVYGGELDRAGATDILTIAPALLIGYMGSKIEFESVYTDLVTARFGVIVVTKNKSGHEGREKEALDIIDAVETAVHRQNLGLDNISRVFMSEDELIAETKSQVAYAVEVTAQYGKDRG